MPLIAGWLLDTMELEAELAEKMKPIRQIHYPDLLLQFRPQQQNDLGLLPMGTA